MTPVSRGVPFTTAVHRLLEEFAWNPWFLATYWPENAPRVRLIADTATARVGAGGRVLDVGCFNGYLAVLLQQLGFRVTTADAYEDDRRADLLRRHDIAYHTINLNDHQPLARFASASFDLVLLGEVFEHILNHPMGVLQAVRRILRPGGVLIVTTPNPSSLANAVRVLLDRYVLWGTTEFLTEAKFAEGRIIDRGEIHYREYPGWILRDLLGEAGFTVGGVRYVRAGIAATHALPKRWLKHALVATGLANRRLFAPTYLIWASAGS